MNRTARLVPKRLLFKTLWIHITADFHFRRPIVASLPPPILGIWDSRYVSAARSNGYLDRASALGPTRPRRAPELAERQSTSQSSARSVLKSPPPLSERRHVSTTETVLRTSN